MLSTAATDDKSPLVSALRNVYKRNSERGRGEGRGGGEMRYEEYILVSRRARKNSHRNCDERLEKAGVRVL